MNTSSPIPARHRWFDDWRSARGSALKALVGGVRAEVEALEESAGARKRRRKEADQRRFEVAVEVVVSNLAHAVLVPPETGRLSIVTGNGDKGFDRYDNPALGKPLRSLLGHIVEMKLAEWHRPQVPREAWSLAPTATLADRVCAAGVSLLDFGRIEGEETIILSCKVSSSGDLVRRLIDYPEGAEATAMRQDMNELNRFLVAADITFLDDGTDMVETAARTMRRHFVRLPEDESAEAPIRFDLSGRLFGGFWQSLNSHRRLNVRIGGEPVVELDYGQMAVRLAYASIGTEPPEGDMYALPGLEGRREAVKKALNVLLNDRHRRQSWPAALTQGDDEVDSRELLPEGWTVKRTKAAILARHPALTPCLGAGLGLKLMHTESEILMAVLIEMKARGIVGLGIHDGLLVQASRAEETRLIMEEMAVAKAGATIPVSVTAPSV